MAAISKQEKNEFLKPESQFIGSAYLQTPSQNKNVNVGQHRLYNHSKSLIQDIFNTISFNKEFFTMIDGIFTYYGNTQIIKILLSIIQCDHKFRLQLSHQNNIKSFIDHNYYKYDIMDTDNYIDLFNDISRKFLDENTTEISKDEIIKTIYNNINNELLTDCHSQIQQLLTKFKSNLNHSIINHQTQYDFIEWLLLIMLDIYNCSSVIQPIFDFQNNKPQTTDIILTYITKNELISCIQGVDEGKNDNNDINDLKITCQEKDNTLRVRLYCTQEKWIKIDLQFNCEEYKQTTENVGENSFENNKQNNILVSVQNRNNDVNDELKYWVGDDSIMLQTVLQHLVCIFAGILIPHKIRGWTDLFIMINCYIEQHIADVQHRLSKNNLSIMDDNYLYNTQNKNIAKNISKYSIDIYSRDKYIAFELTAVSSTDCMHPDLLKDSVLISFGELKELAESQTDKILSKTKEQLYALSTDKRTYLLRFSAEKHQFIVLPKLVHRFKSHSQTLIETAIKELSSPPRYKIDKKVMTAIGAISLQRLEKEQNKQKQKHNVQKVYNFIEAEESMVPVEADIKYNNLCFAFHCTSVRNIENIMSEGLKKGGDYIESTGYQIPISHGSRWGTGVYLSCDYTLARYYAGTDLFERQAVLVNLVHLGRVHRLTWQEVNAVRNFTRKRYSYYEYNRKQTHWYNTVSTLPCWQSSPGIEGVYKCGANTHISPDGKQIICASARQVLPVLQSIIQKKQDPDCENWKLAPKTHTLRSAYALSKEYQWLHNMHSLSKRAKKKMKKNKHKQQDKMIHIKKLCSLTAMTGVNHKPQKKSKIINVHDDLWTITLNEEVLSKVGLESNFKMTGCKLLFGIDISKSMAISKTYRKRVLPACAQIYRDLQPDAAGAVFFGDNIYYEPLGSIKTPSKLLSEQFMKKKLEEKRNVLGCFEKLVDVITNDYNKYKSEEKLDAYKQTQSNLYGGYIQNTNLQKYNRDRPIRTVNQYCKSIVKAMTTQAVNIGQTKIKYGITPMLKRKYDAKVSRLVEKKDNMYVVILFVSGDDTKNDEKSVEDFFKEFKFAMNSYFNTNLEGIKVIVKIVALHSSDDNYYAPIRLKYLLQTVSVYESKPIYYANKKKLLSVVAKEIIQDIKLLSGTSKLQIQIPFARVILDEGFVTNLTKNPNWNASIRLPPNGDYTLLFRGRPPVQLVINDMTVNCIHDNIESNKRDYSYDSVLAMIQQMVSDLKIAVLAKRDVNAAIKIIRYIISVIKGQCLKINMYDEKMTVQERIGKMKRNKQLISDLETVMNDIIFIVDYSKSKENVTKKIEWIYKIKKMKFGQKSMKRAKKYRDEELNANNILNELLIIKQQYHLSNDNEGEGQEYHDDEYKQDEGAGVSDVTKLYTIIKSESSKRTSWSHLLDIFESLDLLLADVNDDIINTDLNLVDLLYCLGIVGIGIRVGRIEASNIDPWQLKIKYVSHCYNDSVSAMCALDSALDTFEIDKKHIITKIKDKNCDKIINENKEETKSEEEYIPDVMMVLNRMEFKKEYFKNILLMNVMRSDLYSIYLASVFTRNPNLVIPSQKISILMISFIQTVQQIFVTDWSLIISNENEYKIKKLINNALNIMYCIRLWVGKINANKDGYWYELIQKLYQDNPGRFMTNSQNENISSVCKILAAICCFDESSKLFIAHQNVYKLLKQKKDKIDIDKSFIKQQLRNCQLSRIAIAMMGESTSRECKILLKNDKNEMWKLIGKCLGVKESKLNENKYNKWYNDGKVQKGILFQDSFNLEKATKASAKFFNKQLKTNCTPHSIVACLGFTNCLYQFINNNNNNSENINTIWDLLISDDLKMQNNLINFIYKKFKTKKITMKSFMKYYLANTNPIYVQIALYIQGLRYHTSKTRRDGLPELIDPLPIINKISNGYRQHKFEQYVKKRNKELRAKLEREAKFNRQKRLLFEQNEFLLIHEYPQVPKIFSSKEVEILNKSRDINDQLELLSNCGLLKHHCCFPKCEYYLVNLATEKDKIMGTRHGLWRHLRYLQMPSKDHYIKNFHVNAYKLLRRVSNTSNNKCQFKIKMKEIYRNCSLINIDLVLDATYDSFFC